MSFMHLQRLRCNRATATACSYLRKSGMSNIFFVCRSSAQSIGPAGLLARMRRRGACLERLPSHDPGISNPIGQIIWSFEITAELIPMAAGFTAIHPLRV
jgi:hypothetical protein